MKKIKVEICLGTTCYILGASALQELESFLPPELVDRVEIVGCPCLGGCRNRDFGQAPFVRINGRVLVEKADVERVTDAIRKELAGL